MLNNFTNILMPTENELKNRYKIFKIALVLSFLVFMPLVVYDKGIFLLVGDFNIQQIPFYKLAHDAIRNGEFGLNWYTDLGSNFIGSYSFYLLGSPFFWLTIPFPNSFLPYLMAPLLILKFSVAALTSYIFIRKFTKTAHTAFLGALMYSFSGFSIYNVFYNHFHEIIAFFPILLIGFEDLISKNKKGIFALGVALNLIVSYYFFVPEIVFLFLYFIFRCFCKDFKINIKTFLFLATEFVIGVAIGFILFLPSALMTLKNPRVAGTLLGFDIIFYETVQKYGLILQSLFFPPDMPPCPNVFRNMQTQWASVAAYIPMVGMIGVLAFIKGEKKGYWLKKLLITLFIFMFIPFLNSAFNGFNPTFYTRWFFALTLVFALCSAIAIEKHIKHFKAAAKLNIKILICFSIIGFLPKMDENKNVVFFMLPKYPEMFWTNFAIAVLGVILTTIFTSNQKNALTINAENIYRRSILIFCIFTISYSLTQLIWEKGDYKESNPVEEIVQNGLNAKFNIEDKDFYRMEILPEQYSDNLNMFWKMPSVQAFQSTVPASIMHFYTNLGIERPVHTKIPMENHNFLRDFLSVKYIFVPNKHESEVKGRLPKRFEFLKEENNFKIYKNRSFLKMGLFVDSYIRKQEFLKLDTLLKEKILLKAAVLSDEQIEKYKDILSPISEDKIIQLRKEPINFNELIGNNASNFKPNSYGFEAKINTKKDGLVLFTVPFENTFKAKVNGKTATVEEVDSGIMAVKCEKGENKIKFSYSTPGLKIAIIISITGILIYFVYIYVNYKFRRN